MDYNAELKKLEEFSGDFWKPKAGQYKVVAKSELTDAEPAIFGEGDKEEVQPRAKISINVSGKDFVWNFPKGKTPASTYGQLVKLGSAKGKLVDEEFTVVVVGEGQNIRFTIVI